MTSRRPLKHHAIGIGPPGLLAHLRAIKAQGLGLCGTPTPADRMEVDPDLVTCNSCRSILSRDVYRHAVGYLRAIDQLVQAHPDEWADLLENELVMVTLRGV